MTTPDFIHLHNHSHYSVLDALCRPEQLIDAAIADGQQAIALTDHGVMFGTIEFYYKALKKKIKPIVGMEAYVATGSRFDKSSGKINQEKKKRNYYHLVLLAKDETGYKNLLKLTSLAHTEGFYYKPRIDRELLESHSSGLVALSACIAGVVSAPLVAGDYDDAIAAAKYYKDMFGEDFYIELQNHNLPEDKIILTKAPEIAKKLGIKLVASNDIHYMKKEHAVAHNIQLLIRDVTAANSANVDIHKLRYRQPEMYFKTREEMAALFPDFPDALSNTLEIADKCNLEISNKLYMPEFPIPVDSNAKTLDEFLTELTWKGIEQRFPVVTDEIRNRTEYELSVIKNMGFSGYFLIVQDFIRAANELGVRVGPGRGSAAGSIVAFALKITNIDPLPYDLLFERFLNPERVSMPDIDIDFSDDKRDLVINYVKEKYGENAVAQIITFGKLLSRAVLTDVGRVLNVELNTIKEITSKIPTVFGKVKSIKESLELPELKWVKDTDDPKIKQLIEYSQLLEGVIRNTSTHAAGVVIAPGEITDYVPIYQPSKSKNQSVEVATQYSMNELESAGLLKMDFLGLRTLSIIDNTLEMIHRNYGIKIDIDSIDFSDKKTYELLSEGATLAVFQFESGGMQEYLKKLKPHNLEEIAAMNALYRPGPMDSIPDFIDRKHGKKPVEYLHPLMKNSLEKTFGIIVYQEQVMQLVCDVAGFSLGQADILRRAMGKKQIAYMDEQKPVFIEGAMKRGITQKIAVEIFDLIYKFANYGFNKSHALAYSYLAYQTAWLKAHYTAEFLAANMTAELGDQDKIVSLIDEAKRYGIKVLPPDVNRSVAQFNAVDNQILFGMAGIKNVGISAVNSIVAARETKKFNSIFDFVSRVDTRLINKRAMEALVCSGAFDTTCKNPRASVYLAIEPALEYAKAFTESESSGMDSLFGGGEAAQLQEPKMPDVKEWAEKEMLDREKEFLNFYISGHPLNRFEPHCKSFATMNLNESDPEKTGSSVRVCGMITDIRNKYDRKDRPIAFVMLEDFYGKGECIFWSDAYSKFKGFLEKDVVLMIQGKVSFDNDKLKITVDDVMSLEDAVAKFGKGYKIWLDLEKEIDIKLINEIFKMQVDMPEGSTKLIFNVFNKTANYRRAYISGETKLIMNDKNTYNLMKLFGSNNVRICTE